MTEALTTFEPIVVAPPEQPQASTTSAFRWATVMAVSPLRIKLDGDLNQLPFVPEVLDLPALEVDQRVWVQLHGRRVIVLGSSTLTPPTPTPLQGYTSYVPTLSNITVGTGGATYGWYTVTPRFGGEDWIDGGFYLVFGTSPSISATCSISLPRAVWSPASDLLQLSVGTWIFRDQSPTLHHFSGALGTWNAAGTDVSMSGTWDGTAPQSRITTDKPFTVASTDVLSGEFHYRAAAV